MSISRAGLQASLSQLATSAAQIVQSRVPASPTPQAVRASHGAGGGVASGDAAGLVGQMMALASYRANVRVLQTESRMAKATLDLMS